MDREALLLAGDRNLAHTLRLISRVAPGGTVDDDGRLLLVSASATWPGPYHNGAFRLDPSVPAGEVLDRAQAFFAGRCPAYSVWIAAHADADLEEAALGAGLAQISPTGSPRMAIEHPVPPGIPREGVSLSEVEDEPGRLDYLAVAVDAYAEAPLPPDAVEAQLAGVEALHGPDVRAVVAHGGGRPVSAAMVVLSDGVAGIQMVGTVPGARGHGLGELCTRWAVDVGFGMGAAAVVLEASEAGEPLYRRLGFAELSRYRWCLGPPRH